MSLRTGSLVPGAHLGQGLREFGKLVAEAKVILLVGAKKIQDLIDIEITHGG